MKKKGMEETLGWEIFTENESQEKVNTMVNTIHLFLKDIAPPLFCVR